MKFTFLGTGSGVPAKHRNVSSLALHLMDKKGAIWLFDCGEGTQQQILHTKIKLRKIEKIFITHLHGDHIFGLPGLLGSRSFQGGETPLKLYGPKGIKEYIDISLRVSGTYLRYPLTIKEFEETGQLIEEKDFTVWTGVLVHGLPSFGFRLEQRDSPGSLLMDKVKEADIPIGPLLQKLKEGEKVQLPDGRFFYGKNFVGPPKKGKVIAVLGDTRFTDGAVQLASGADTLIHEATFSSEDHVIAEEYFHSTTVQAAEVAKLASAKQLILNHISSRYQQEDTHQLLAEAREIFPNTFIAEDFSSFDC
ncbi:ribonuclease Z [Evansella vedderi]|uniref:Ribonuclease Z n=1 Tax=Evansella vedderi TaxID=38282 RepID=A0ABU0A0J3_9BACI|nr:ribonuclease Z [Evansella vedderi]MDQ0257002.1 ribonuclease Z [Evansella vedderi]